MNSRICVLIVWMHISLGQAQASLNDLPTEEPFLDRPTSTSTRDNGNAVIDENIESTPSPFWLNDRIFPDAFDFDFDLRQVKVPHFLLKTLPVFANLKAAALYKPPVGMISAYLCYNLLFRKKGLLAQLSSMGEDQESKTFATTRMSTRSRTRTRRRKNVGRSLYLDSDDGKLLMGFGGVETVRAELCTAALQESILPLDVYAYNRMPLEWCEGIARSLKPTMVLSDPDVKSYYACAAKDALEISAAPQSPAIDFVERSLEPLIRLQGLFALHGILGEKLITQQNNADILWLSAKVAEVRTTDALLRVLRERLLMSAVRLSKKEAYRKWRMSWYENGLGRNWKRWFRRTTKGKTLEDDRKNLQLTSAALKREMRRLGEVQALLLQRPAELCTTTLLAASSFTADELEGDCIEYTEPRSQSSQCAGDIIPKVAIDALRSADPLNRRWYYTSKEWTKSARILINELISETLSGVFSNEDHFDTERKTTIGQDLETLSEWSVYNKCDAEGWEVAVTLADNLSKSRLMRENKYLPSAELELLKKFDLYGIPSAIVTALGALAIHNLLYIPFWPKVVEFAKLIGKTVYGVLEVRFLTPLKEFVQEILNLGHKQGLLDEFSLEDEETSLDNMLRDLGVGDGTKESRAAALLAAAQMYEKELKSGATWNIIRGNMVTLLLIQVQQMKTGLLQAMESIDSLIDSNRLNIILVSTGVPAILLVTISMRLISEFLFSVRSKELVGLSTAKVELGDLLRKMERCLLLSNRNREDDNISASKEVKDQSECADNILQPSELGEFILHMHFYLVILDFCSPPFAAKSCDTIHAGLQDLLIQGQLGTKQQIALLQLIITKHKELMKSIR